MEKSAKFFETEVIIKKFYYNYYLVIIAAIFFFNVVLMGFSGTVPLILLIISLIVLFGSIVLMWRINIYEDGICIKYFVSLGRNRIFQWKDIEKVNILTQYYRGVRIKELLVVPKKGRPIKFFRLGVLNYKYLSIYLKEIFYNRPMLG